MRQRSPDDLWARIDQSMVEAGAERRRRRSLLGSWRGPIVAAVVVVLGLLGVVIYGSGWQPPGALHGRVVQEAVQEMQGFIADRRPLDLASSDPVAIRSWLAGKVDFAPPLPVVAAEAELVGGRLCLFLRRSIAAYIYRADGQLIALYVMPAEGIAPPAGATVTLAGRGASVSELRGFVSVFWQEGDLAYVLVSGLPQTRLIGIADALAGAG